MTMKQNDRLVNERVELTTYQRGSNNFNILNRLLMMFTIAIVFRSMFVEKSRNYGSIKTDSTTTRTSALID